MAGPLSPSGVAAVLGLGAVVCACGSAARLPETSETPPLATSSVAVSQTGTAPVTIVPDSVTYRLDDSGSLVVHLRVTSGAPDKQTIEARASLYDGKGALIGDATGGQVDVDPGSTVSLQLNGPAPTGEIVSSTFEFTTLPIPTISVGPTPSPT
jgi:hypothetical protein